jgi:hypothetical protein
LVPYLQVTTSKYPLWDILFLHKDITTTCKKNMGDANEYKKLLEFPSKPKKIANSKKNSMQKIKSYQKTIPMEPKKLE